VPGPAHRPVRLVRRAPRVRLTAVVAAATLGLLVVLPLSGGPAGAGSTGKTTFTVGITQDVDSLNPFTGIVASAYEMYQLTYDTLTDYGQADFAAEPSIAESWDTSEDGLTWTYTIRDGVQWSDGKPLTARDVAYSFNRVMNGKYEQTNFGNYVSSIASVEAPDDRTVVMKTKTPSPSMLHLFVYILPEHIWKDVDGKEVRSYTNEPGPDGVVGSGPFIITEHKKGQFIRLAANENHWRGAPAIDELVFRIFQNEDSLAQALRRGEIDFADDLGSNVYESLDGADGVTTYPARYSGFDEIAFNVGAALDDGTPIGDGHPALKDQRVRVALSHAIDTKTLTERVLGGHGTPGTSVIPPIYEDLHYDPGADTYAFDPEEAKRLLDEAGYTEGPDGVRTMPGGGRELSFRLLGRSNSQTSQQSVQFVAGWLEDVGVEVKTKIVSEDALTEIIGEGTFDMFEWGWVVEPDPDYQLSTFLCANRSYKDGGSVFANLSDSFFCDDEYDALYEQQKQQIDPAERAATVKEMQRILYEQAPYVVTFYYDNLEAYRSDRFTGFKPQPEPDGSLLFQYGTHTYRSIRPVTAEDRAEDGEDKASDGGTSAGLVTGAVVAGGVVLGGIVFLALRGRRRPEHDVE
jgi:peptide/nickel transport system substrate-binding protein